MGISRWRARFEQPRDSRIEAMSPFLSFAEMRAAYVAASGFRKARFRQELAGVRIRSRLAEFASWLPLTAARLFLSPVPLCFQILPERKVVVRVV
jgi:hypothetical protein